MRESNFEITNKTKGKLPRLPFLEMKEAVVGKRYDLSLVLIGEVRSKSITKKYRKKDKVSNVLSFPIDKNVGEIFITPSAAKREAKKFAKTQNKQIGFLFIHGLLHLKGYTHGSTMESKEKALSKRFGV
jgi:probable rRNA maturation factor